eukprot:gene33441-42941_t
MLNPTPGYEATIDKVLIKTHYDHMQCWHKHDIPKNLNFGTNPRVPEIVCLSDIGWLIGNLEINGKGYKFGAHGYDPAFPEMNAIFIANGPAIRPGVRLKTFDNVDVYSLEMKLLGLKPEANDGSDNLALFFALVFGIIIVPGMDMAFVMASGLSGGRKAGLAAVGGIVVGGWVHSLWAAFGVGLLIKTLPWLFNILLLGGAAYIAWIGWSLVRSHIVLGQVDAAPRHSTLTTFRQGVVTCLLNPKAYLFMLAVYPQFIQSQYGPVAAQAAVM